MASKGIRDRVAIVGMGCTNFGEHWDKGADDLLVDSATAAFASAGVTKDDIDAFWLGTMGSGISGLTLSRPLKLDYKPVTRLENIGPLSDPTVTPRTRVYSRQVASCPPRTSPSLRSSSSGPSRLRKPKARPSTNWRTRR